MGGGQPGGWGSLGGGATWGWGSLGVGQPCSDHMTEEQRPSKHRALDGAQRATETPGQRAARLYM